MTSEERDLITGLFNRLRAADTTPKDQEAEQLIGQLGSSQPGAAYRLVQTLLVQEHALNNATVRIQQLEKQVADAQASGQPQSQGGGGFLSGLFGQHASTPAPAPAARPSSAPSPLPIPPQQLPQQTSQYSQSAPPYPSTVGMAPSAGGGFLRGALQTAAGVAGGSLIAQGIESLMGHHYGPFGGYGGGGGGFFGGGYGGGGSEIIENNTTEVVNNYVDERGSGGSEPGYQETQREDNRGDVERGDGGGGAFTDAGFNTNNPFDAPTDDSGGTAMDNTFDADNTDAASTDDFAGDNGGGNTNDDSSLV